MENIAHALRMLRHLNDLSLAEISAQTRVSINWICKMEKARKDDMNFTTLEKISQFYGLKISELFKFAEILADGDKKDRGELARMVIKGATK